MDGWGEASLASRCRTCPDNLGNPGPPSARRTHPAPELRAAHHGTVRLLCAVPCLSCGASTYFTPTTPSFSFPTTSTISIISSSCPQVTRCSQSACCMRVCVQAWHTTMCPELSVETIRLSTLISLLSQSRQADISFPPALHNRPGSQQLAETLVEPGAVWHWRENGHTRLTSARPEKPVKHLVCYQRFFLGPCRCSRNKTLPVRNRPSRLQDSSPAVCAPTGPRLIIWIWGSGNKIITMARQHGSFTQQAGKQIHRAGRSPRTAETYCASRLLSYVPCGHLSTRPSIHPLLDGSHRAMSTPPKWTREVGLTGILMGNLP